MHSTADLNVVGFVPPDPVKIATDFYLLKMPLPFRLNHINIYLLEDDDGWSIIDCGLDNDITIQVWEHLLSTFFGNKRIKSVFVTHLHPDHIGVAYWLQDNTDAVIYMSHDEWVLANNLLNLDTESSSVLIDHYTRFGLSDESIQDLISNGPIYRRLINFLPNEVSRIKEGDILTIGKRKWEVRIGKGHSPEHVCFWNKNEKLLISGDHILPTITPNISLMVLGLQNPLSCYLKTLNDFKILSAKQLFPAHGDSIENVNERIDEIINHHEVTLEKLLKFCSKPKSVNDCAIHLFGSKLVAIQFGFALGEAAAHLVYLSSLNKVKNINNKTWMFSTS